MRVLLWYSQIAARVEFSNHDFTQKQNSVLGILKQCNTRLIYTANFYIIGKFTDADVRN